MSLMIIPGRGADKERACRTGTGKTRRVRNRVENVTETAAVPVEMQCSGDTVVSGKGWFR